MHVVNRLFPEAAGARLWLCLLLTLAGVLLRLWDIYDIGIVDDDMAYYAIFGEYYRKLIFSNYPPYFGLDIAYKPAFLLTSLIGVTIIGLTEYTLPAVNALISVGIGIFVYRLALLVSKDRYTPILSLGATTFTPFLVYIDRLGMSHTGATLFILISIYYLILWTRYSWSGPLWLMRRAALFLGGAFLFHPTILIYCFTLGAVISWHVLMQRARPISERLRIILKFSFWAASPLLVCDVLYRIIFLVQPALVGWRGRNIFGYSYLGDVFNGFAMAGVSGEGKADPAFAWNALHVFDKGSFGQFAAAAILSGIGLFLWRLWRRERLLPFTFIAVVPLLMMAYNPYVGQYARALHATLPMLWIMAASAITAVVGAMPRDKYRPMMLGGIILCVAGAGSAISVQNHLASFRSSTANRDELNLPRFLLGDLKDSGINKVYIYYSGLYGAHWFFYLNKYFDALPFVVQNRIDPLPFYSFLFSPSEMEAAVRDGRAEIVIMRRMDDRVARVWKGRGKEEDFLAMARKLGGRRIEGLGHLDPFPEQLYVYDFRPQP